MKIRILDDSIRLRLDRSEVHAIGQGDAVTSGTHFPGGAVFSCCLRAAAELGATFEDGRMEISVPHAQARHWAITDGEVSIRGRLAGPRGELALLVEKDFECLNPREGESQANRFPNPAS